MKTKSNIWKLLPVGLLFLFLGCQARAEWFFSVYGGWVNTEPTDMHLQEAGDDVTFHNVEWADESFTGSPYGGYRLGYWFDRKPNWGLSVEWIHAKMVADLAGTVSVTGTRNGPEVLGNTFQNLEFSHGHNIITLNLQHRWFLTEPEEKSFWSRIEPYAGIGAGVVIPHLEVTTTASKTEEYQMTGPACQGFAGFEVRLFKYASLYMEGKLSYADISADLGGGGKLHLDPFSEHFVVGLTLHAGRPNRKSRSK